MLPLDPSAVPPETIRPLKRVEYDRLVAAGSFGEERLELLYGRLVSMRPQGTEHVYCVRRLTTLLVPALLGRAQVQVQGPVAASDESEPEPDVAVLALDDFLDDRRALRTSSSRWRTRHAPRISTSRHSSTPR
jgi:Uma2 family endonuclease